MTATLSALGGGSGSAESSGRQPDYFVGANGIPRLVRATTTTSRSSAVDQQRRKMYQCSGGGGGGSVGTDPVKLNKCLYNLTVRNKNGSNKIGSDLAIRSQCSYKTNSPSSGSDSNYRSISTSAVSSATSSTTVIATGLGDNRRNPVMSSRGSSYIPRSGGTHWAHPSSRNANKSGTVINGSNLTVNGESNGRSYSATLLNDRQRRNANAVCDSNRLHDGECGSSLMRQCRFTMAVRRSPPTPPTMDNRLNYQRKYDRSVFGYNRLDQIVLPPLQI